MSAGDDGNKSYALALACMREKRIRNGSIRPSPVSEREQRWAREGAVADCDLETLRGSE